MTPTVARMVAAKRRDIGFPARWYSIQNFFRYQRPQRGRGREFWQLNADIFGIDSSEADIECIALSHDIMKAFGAQESDFEIKVSSRKLMNAVFNNWFEMDAQKTKAMQKLIDKKAKLPPEVFAEEAEKIVGEPFEFLNLSHGSADYAEAMAFPEIRQAKEELDIVLDTLKARGIKNVSYDETLIRGFDYYTGIVFEVFDTNPENNRSIFGGGRFDELLSLFGDEKVSAVGFGMGDMTIQTFLESRNLIPAYRSTTDAMICILDEDAKDYAEKVAAELRSKDINIALNYTYKSLGDQIKSATKQGIPYIIPVGSQEAEKSTYIIKDIVTGAEVQEIKK
jgi:histidyl-tRNA synthetase